MAIPLPGQPGQALLEGLNSGSSMFSRLMQPVMQQQQMGMDWERHLQNKAFQEAEAQRMASQFAQDYALRQAAAQRAAQLFPFQQQNLQAQAAQQQAQAAKASMIQNLISRYMQGGTAPQMPMGAMGDMQGVPMTSPTMELSSQMGMGLGQGMGTIPQEPVPPPFVGGTVNPMIAGLIKSETGIDLNAQNPLQKQQMELETHSRKQGIEVGTAKTKERNKQEEKYRAENLQSLEDAQQSLADINQVKDLLGEPGTQQYDYATSALGPLDARTPALRTGTRLFRGEFERLSGRLKSNIARLEKGATSDKERAMIDKAEISDTDTWTVAKGKLTAQEKYLNRLIARKTRIADLMNEGFSREEALRKSMQEVSLDDKGQMGTKTGSLADPLGIRS